MSDETTFFWKNCKKYQALYKQHHYSPSTILTSESLTIETVSTTIQIPACLYGPENLRRSHSNLKAGALKQPKLLYLFKCIFNSFWSTKLLYGPWRTYRVPVVSYLFNIYLYWLKKQIFAIHIYSYPITKWVWKGVSNLHTPSHNSFQAL